MAKFFSALVFSGFFFAGMAWSKPLQVVVSIQPIHSMVAAISDGVFVPHLLMSASQSPHNFNFKPSQIRQLHRADWLLWTAPQLEPATNKVVQSLPSSVRVSQASEIDNLTLLPVNQRSTNHDHHSHKVSVFDAHFWLSTVNAEIMLGFIAEQLVVLDPEHQAEYENNLKRTLARLLILRQSIKQQLSGVQDRGFVVFHDAYQYFEREFSLNSVGFVAISPDRLPGVKRVQMLRKQLKGSKVECVFSEPQFQPKLLHVLTEGTEVSGGVLDPVGSAIAPGPEAYFQLMQNLADGFENCLRSSGETTNG